jgi:Zn-dependent protease
MFIETLLTDPIYFFRYILVLIVSIVIHELAHGYAAIGEGDDTPQRLGHITPDPIVHMGPASLIMLCFMGMAWGQMPVNPTNFRHRWSDLWVSAAGPLSNFALSTVFCILLAIAKTQNVTWLSTEFLFLAAVVNMMLFFFNMLPIPPLDGFTVFSELFPNLKPLRDGPIGIFLLVVVWTVPAVNWLLMDVLTRGTVKLIVNTMSNLVA